MSESEREFTYQLSDDNIKAIIQGTEWTYLTAAEVGKEFVIGINRGMKNAYTANGTRFSHQPTGQQNIQRHNLRRPRDTLVSRYKANFLGAMPSSRHHLLSHRWLLSSQQYCCYC